MTNFDELKKRLWDKYGDYVKVGDSVQGESWFWQGSSSDDVYMPITIKDKEYEIHNWASNNPYSGSYGYSLKEKGAEEDLFNVNFDMEKFLHEFDLLISGLVKPADDKPIEVLLEDEVKTDRMTYVGSDFMLLDGSVIMKSYENAKILIERLQRMLNKQDLDGVEMKIKFRHLTKAEKNSIVRSFEES